MPIRAAAVGHEIGPFETEVTTRRLLAYAAGLGECADIHFDDARPGGIVAPPMMVIPLEWPASRNLRETPEFGATDDERRRVVHAEQDTEIHAPIRPGIQVRAIGRLVTVRRVKPGALSISKLTLETDAGEKLATSYATAIYRGVEIDGPDTVEETPPAWPDAPPQSAWTESRQPIARELPHIYTECADIWNPIHTERAFALASGLPDIILHGTCTLALAIKAVVAGPLGGDPLRLKRFGCRFSGMVIPGTEIAIRLAAAPWGAAFEVANADGGLAISHGRAVFAE